MRAVFNACHDVAEKLTALEHDDYEGVITVFREMRKPAGFSKGDVFWELDNHYGLYGDYRKWHPLLRKVRNTPELGKRLFSIWSQA